MNSFYNTRLKHYLTGELGSRKRSFDIDRYNKDLSASRKLERDLHSTYEQYEAILELLPETGSTMMRRIHISESNATGIHRRKGTLLRLMMIFNGWDKVVEQFYGGEPITESIRDASIKTVDKDELDDMCKQHIEDILPGFDHKLLNLEVFNEYNENTKAGRKPKEK